MSLLTPLIWLAISIPLLIIAYFTSKETNFKYILLFGAYFLVDCYARILGYEYIKLDFMGLKGNWSGNYLSFIIALIFILYHKKEIREAMGFTTKFTKKTVVIGVLFFLVFLVFDFIFKMNIYPKGGQFDLQSFLFQATTPGLTEEIVFRGILLWILSKAFVPKKKIKGVAFGWGFIIVTFLFAMIHGVILTKNMNFMVDYVTIIYLTLVTSLSLGVLRKFSGNLILPTLAHNVVNLMNFFIRLL
ncbi:CPBP family intramembrane metalloprotease [Cellulophaga baltica]|uniref:CPBP family intramembrane glutamic endopeptidase n=1 Tax=Cellulophaga TaxID=104264 RepID=UPI001C078BFF|nr:MULTISPECIES: CPBP family intramembrane glutamic endopeptidase [Cellulophaga]MBU2997133.1 CPBP family intramembrane metalloprotease [Cellulophaga baltica]MDO6768531.1 CPBP family intramembrane metalloprotease [Cellulophaga sp. 1_MG-2023]